MPRAGLHPDAVVDAAQAIADADGLEAVTLARVAAALGVRTPSLYAHVKGLGDLRVRLGVRGVQDLAEALTRAAAGRAGVDALRAVAAAYRAYASAHPGTYAAAQRAHDLRRATAGVAAGGAAVEAVVAVVRGYGLTDADAVHATRIIRAALHGFVMLEAVDGFAIELSVDDTFDRLVATLDQGLSASSRSG